MRAQREFVADASHQIRTPLTGVKLQLEEALAAARDDAAREPLRAADREIDRLTAILSRLLTKAAGEGRTSDATADLRAVADRAQVRWQSRAERAGTTIVVTGSPASVVADDADLAEICDALLENALGHGAGPIDIRISSDGAIASLVVVDRGRGFDPSQSERLTERFERGEGAGAGGTGLGLAIARELTERWGGRLTLASGTGETTATAAFRVANAEREP